MFYLNDDDRPSQGFGLYRRPHQKFLKLGRQPAKIRYWIQLNLTSSPHRFSKLYFSRENIALQSVFNIFNPSSYRYHFHKTKYSAKL